MVAYLGEIARTFIERHDGRTVAGLRKITRRMGEKGISKARTEEEDGWSEWAWPCNGPASRLL